MDVIGFRKQEQCTYRYNRGSHALAIHISRHCNLLLSPQRFQNDMEFFKSWAEDEGLCSRRKADRIGRCEQMLGKEHPETLMSINNVAIALSRRGEYSEVITLMQECFQLRTQILRPQHPRTKASLRVLDKWQLES